MKILAFATIKAILIGACLPALIQAEEDEASVSVTVKAKNGYDKAITVTYTNPNTPTTTDYIGLYSKKGGDCDGLSFWVYTSCNSQNSCSSVAPSSGSVTFDVTDPSAEACGKQWPPPKGKYEACLGWETGSGDEIISCSDMKIKRPPRKALNSLSLSMSKSSYSVDEAIVSTFSTNKMIRNSWVGVYSGSPTSGKKIPEPMLWVYVGCNNQQGDQSENNDCSVVRTSGQLQIDETSTDRSTASWPLMAGTYHLCISLDNNRPYKFFKCFDTFTIA